MWSIQKPKETTGNSKSKLKGERETEKKDKERARKFLKNDRQGGFLKRLHVFRCGNVVFYQRVFLGNREHVFYDPIPGLERTVGGHIQKTATGNSTTSDFSRLQMLYWRKLTDWWLFFSLCQSKHVKRYEQGPPFLTAIIMRSQMCVWERNLSFWEWGTNRLKTFISHHCEMQTYYKF